MQKNIFMTAPPSRLIKSIWLTIGLMVVSFLSACTPTHLLETGPFPIPSSRYAALVINAKTGKVLHEVRADSIRFPASLTKMMTMYMIFDALKKGKVSKNAFVPVSARAAAEPASKLWLKKGQQLPLDLVLNALAVKSANDVAYAVAEWLSGSEKAFAQAMTNKARALGMKSTTFKNASGLPNKQQVTTARDMAKLAIALKTNFPQYFYYFNKRKFTYKNKQIKGHNRVLAQLKGANGIKTGYTRASGFNLVTSAKTRQGLVIGVILGENSSRSRNSHMVQLINTYGHRKF